MEKEIEALRGLGWVVGAHNDYYQNGLLHTFWLFTNRHSGRFIKVEGFADDPRVLREAVSGAIEECSSAAGKQEAHETVYG